MRVITMLLATLLTLSACNTFSGMGQDMQDAGQAIEEEAEE
jgi:predicted small secreted protein